LDAPPTSDLVVTIVEGHGDAEAVPVLVRKLLRERGLYPRTKAIRVKRQRVVKPAELEKAIELALLQPGCASILIVLDADGDCPAELGPSLQARAQAVGRGMPVGVVLANQEFESWLLGGIEGLRGLRGIGAAAALAQDPDSIASPKARLDREMGVRSYLETDDQAAFAELLNVEAAIARSRSFRKLVNELAKLMPSKEA
jgi:Domain of unknown function (DUF4276)